MIAVRDLTTADEVFANAKRVRDTFFRPRPMLQAQVAIPAEHAANDATVARVTPDPQLGSRGTSAGVSEEVDAATLLANFKRLTLDRIYGTADGDAVTPPTMAEIRDEIVKEFRISRLELLSERRHQAIVKPRQVLMYLLRKHTTQSLPAIGRFLGGKDHTTVMHGDKICRQRIAKDEAFRAKVEGIEARLQNGRIA